MGRKTKEQRKQEALEYLAEHTKYEYKEERDWSLDHKWLEKHKYIEPYYAERAIEIALGEN